ncbi:MAG: hypothetical protein HQK53_13400, partial [Oligoflexia bacterium]|nr:hypothetical protein [Oligoflexia bacterium]
MLNSKRYHCSFLLMLVLTLAVNFNTAWGGFNIEDGKAKLNISADIIPVYESKSIDTYNAQTFDIERGRLSFKGNANENISFNVRLRFQRVDTSSVVNSTPGSTAANSTFKLIDYAFVGYKFMPEFAIYAGKMGFRAGYANYASGTTPLTRSAFGFMYTGASSYQATIASNSAAIVDSYGVGLKLGGAALDNKISYGLTIINDNDNTTRGNNSDRKFDTVIGFAYNHGGKAADSDGYDVDGDLRLSTGLDYAQQRGKDVAERRSLAPFIFLSYNNIIFHSGYTGEQSRGNPDKNYFIAELG